MRLQSIKSGVCLLVTLAVIFIPNTLGISHLFFIKNKNKYSLDTVTRGEQWRNLMVTAKNVAEEEKLNLVNDFFNQRLGFVDDMDLWGQEDYWATPLEFLSKGAGDCEDFSIAKYFSLIELGVPEKKLRITYVKAIKLDQPHMVLSYYPSSGAVPLLLDNLVPQIKSADNRKDLLPAYSFNDSYLWVVKTSEKSIKVGDSNSLNRWEDLKKRMSQE